MSRGVRSGRNTDCEGSLYPFRPRRLDEVLDYLAPPSPQSAARVTLRIQSFVELLSLHPFIGTRTDSPGIRRLVMTPLPYLLFYEVGDGEIIVHHVRHTARAPWSTSGSSQP